MYNKPKFDASQFYISVAVLTVAYKHLLLQGYFLNQCDRYTGCNFICRHVYFWVHSSVFKFVSRAAALCKIQPWRWGIYLSVWQGEQQPPIIKCIFFHVFIFFCKDIWPSVHVNTIIKLIANKNFTQWLSH